MYMKRSGLRANTYQPVRMTARATPLQIVDTPLCFIYRVCALNGKYTQNLLDRNVC